AASLKFLIPFSLLVGIGNQVNWPLSPAIAKPEVVSAVGQISQPFSERMQASNFEVTRHAPASKLPVVPNRLPVVLLYVWLCGSGVVVLLWTRDWLRIRGALRAASPLPLNAGLAAMSSRSCVEPGIVGIFRPVLLLPEGIRDRLTTDQLKAILVH